MALVLAAPTLNDLVKLHRNSCAPSSAVKKTSLDLQRFFVLSLQFQVHV